jgi:hypothetical protein
MLALL